VPSRYQNPAAQNLLAGLLLLLITPLMAQAHDTKLLEHAISNTRDAVVKIVVSRPSHSSGEQQEALKEINETFRNNFPNIFSQGNDLQQVGSGLLLTFETGNQGLIVSSAHLIDQAHKIQIELNSGKHLNGNVLGFDTNSDIALLSISLDQADMQAITLPKIAAPNSVTVGMPVYAIGAPFGFSGSVTSGIVSAIREQSGFLQKTDVIQTDVAVNPGNSGGPLFNYAGEVIGITTQIMSTNGGFQGVSFAVSMDSVTSTINRIKESMGPASTEK